MQELSGTSLLYVSKLTARDFKAAPGGRVLNGRLWPCCGVVHSRCHAQMSLRLIALIPPMSGFL